MTLRQWLHAEPFTLSLSSGFFGFFAHAGLVAVLEEEGLRPGKITGCSAGALVGTLWACGFSAAEMLAFFTSIKKEDFWDPGIGFGILRGNKFRQILASQCRKERLEDCNPPVSISVYDLFARKTLVLSEGSIPEIIYTSCAIPPLFQPFRINGRLCLDGAMGDVPALAGVPDGSRVFYHHLDSRSARKRRRDPLRGHRERLEIRMLRVRDLPRVTPDRLAAGPAAFEAVRTAFRERLSEPAD